MLKIEGKTFMNIQEAVQWLLDNNCIPFQCTADYQANTEIGLGTIVNPTPAKVRIGSLIFFADSKVSTVVGITETGFICSDKYNNLVDDVVYVSNVALNVSGHLIVTLSNGDTIDAGLIKQVTNFSINASQHLIVTYNDGSTNDLGAIFSGNINISGSLSVSGDTVLNGEVTGNKISATYSGSFASSITSSGLTIVASFLKAVRNFNELQFIMNCRLANNTASDITISSDTQIVAYSLNSDLASKIYAHNGNACNTATPQGSVAYTTLLITNTGGTISDLLSTHFPRFVNLFHSGNHYFNFYSEGGSITIPANKTLDFEARISLAL